MKPEKALRCITASGLRSMWTAKRPDSIVGFAKEADACPLACVLLEIGTELNPEQFHVGQDGFFLGEYDEDENPVTHYPEEWQVAFMNRVDALEDRDDVDWLENPRAVTAAEALAILNDVAPAGVS